MKNRDGTLEYNGQRQRKQRCRGIKSGSFENRQRGMEKEREKDVSDVYEERWKGQGVKVGTLLVDEDKGGIWRQEQRVGAGNEDRFKVDLRTSRKSLPMLINLQ